MLVPKHLLPLVFLLGADRMALRVAIAPFFPELMARWGTGYTEMGLLYSVFFIASSSLQVPCGLIADRSSPRRLLTASLMVLAAASAWFLAATTWTGALAARVLVGAGAAALFPSMVQLVQHMAPPTQRGLALSMDEAGNSFARVLALAVVPMLAGRLGFTSPQVTLVILTAALGLWVWWVVPAQFPGENRKSARAVKNDSPYAHYSVFRRSLFLVLLAGCTFFITGVVTTWWPTYLRTDLAHSISTAGIIMGVLTAAAMFTSMLTGRLCDRLGRLLPLTTAGNLIIIAALAVMWIRPGAGGAGGALLLGLLVGPGMSVLIVPTVVLLPTLFGSERAGLSSALMIVSGQGAAALSSVLVGYLVDRTGSFTTSWLVCIGVLLLRTVVARLIREPVAADSGEGLVHG